jgi:hypothetical protein
MIVTVGVGIVCLVVGFACGRIKNAKKLAAIKAYAEQAELNLETDGKKVVAAIKAKL